MRVTDEMVHAALKKSVEAGLVPRHPTPCEATRNKEVIREILQAALEPVQPPTPSIAERGENMVFRPMNSPLPSPHRTGAATDRP